MTRLRIVIHLGLSCLLHFCYGINLNLNLVGICFSFLCWDLMDPAFWRLIFMICLALRSLSYGVRCCQKFPFYVLLMPRHSLPKVWLELIGQRVVTTDVFSAILFLLGEEFTEPIVSGSGCAVILSFAHWGIDAVDALWAHQYRQCAFPVGERSILVN